MPGPLGMLGGLAMLGMLAMLGVLPMLGVVDGDSGGNGCPGGGIESPSSEA